MTKWFVTVEAWDDDSDYDVFDSLEDAATAFRGFRDGDEWVGVWREIRLIEHPITDELIARHEAETDELWSLWDVWSDEETVTLDRWDAPTCEQEEFRCRSPREADVMVEGNVFHLCEACASRVGDENVWVGGR